MVVVVAVVGEGSCQKQHMAFPLLIDRCGAVDGRVGLSIDDLCSHICAVLTFFSVGAA